MGEGEFYELVQPWSFYGLFLIGEEVKLRDEFHFVFSGHF